MLPPLSTERTSVAVTGSGPMTPVLAMVPWGSPELVHYGAMLRLWRAKRRRRFRRAMRTAAFVVLALMALRALSFAGGPWMLMLLAVFATMLIARGVRRRLRIRRLERPWSAQGKDLRSLPAHTRDWLSLTRAHLPASAEGVLDQMGDRLDALAQHPESLGAPSEPADALKRLLSEELPELVQGYRRVPAALTQRASHGGSSPEHQLVEGLGIIDAQLAHLHAQLADQDLSALATQLRYLGLKYGARGALSHTGESAGDSRPTPSQDLLSQAPPKALHGAPEDAPP